MLVRRGTQADMRQMIDFIEAQHKSSLYSDIPFDRLDTVKVMEYHVTSPETVTYVSLDNAGTVTGLLAGSLEPFAFNLSKHYATDLWFLSTGGAGALLLKRFIKWARKYGADRIIMGVSSGNPSADALYEAMKFERVGGMYVLR